MIEIYGTSHIAQESYQGINKIIKKEEPDVIAVELDEARLNSMIGKRESGSISLIPLLMKKLQERLGKKTGVMPGEEMLRAVRAAEENEIDLALIDQPISKTIRDIQSIPLFEKAKLVISLLAGFFVPYIGIGEKIDLRKVPDDEFIEKAMEEFQEVFPQLYELLVEERKRIMANNLLALEKRYDKVLAFVGAGHKKGMQEILRNFEGRDSSQ